MTPDQVIQIMQALKKGKAIQAKGYATNNRWVDVNMEEKLRGVQYRVKPEPTPSVQERNEVR